VVDAGLLDQLEENAPRLAAGDAAALAPIVRRAIAAKIRVVREDERERGIRALLNLGHTVGHALEAHGLYKKHLHGEAVALGMVAELSATAKLGLTQPALIARTRTLLERLGLPTTAPHAELAASWPFVASDKKRAMARIRLPVVTAAGEARVLPIPLDELRSAVLASS
jgi:3-dehydroquinate synthetase